MIHRVGNQRNWPAFWGIIKQWRNLAYNYLEQAIEYFEKDTAFWGYIRTIGFPMRKILLYRSIFFWFL